MKGLLRAPSNTLITQYIFFKYRCALEKIFFVQSQSVREINKFVIQQMLIRLGFFELLMRNSYLYSKGGKQRCSENWNTLILEIL